VIARIQGPAMAGALGIISACDITVAARGISFAFTEARLGIAPAMISPFVIRRVGAARAQRLFLTGETFSAEDAERFGLIDRLIAAEALDETVESVCREPGRARRGQGDRRDRALRLAGDQPPLHRRDARQDALRRGGTGRDGRLLREAAAALGEIGFRLQSSDFRLRVTGHFC
jgi:enoyl-CoA hydratase/carnithine racemase